MTSRSRSLVLIATAILLVLLLAPAAQADVCSDVGSPDKCVETQDIAKKAVTKGKIQNNAIDSRRVKNNSLLAVDLKDEAGAAYNSLSGLGDTLPILMPVEVVLVTLTAPRAGYAIVNASGYFDFNNIAGSGRCGIERASILAIPFNHLIIAEFDGRFIPFAGTRGFSVAEGVNGFHLVCDAFSGTVDVSRPNLTVIYVPTAYGTTIDARQPGGTVGVGGPEEN